MAHGKVLLSLSLINSKPYSLLFIFSLITTSEEVSSEDEDDDGGDEDFRAFTDLANELLGLMPEEFQEAFISGPDIEFFSTVFNDPTGASDDDRRAFVELINRELGSAPDAVTQRLVQDIELAKRIKIRYG